MRLPFLAQLLTHSAAFGRHKRDHGTHFLGFRIGADHHRRRHRATAWRHHNEPVTDLPSACAGPSGGPCDRVENSLGLSNECPQHGNPGEHRRVRRASRLGRLLAELQCSKTMNRVGKVRTERTSAINRGSCQSRANRAGGQCLPVSGRGLKAARH